MITPLLPASSRSGQGREYPTDRPTEARIRQSARFGHRLILAMLWLDDLGKDINRPIAPSHALGWGDLPGKGIASDKTWCREGLPNSVGQKTLTSGTYPQSADMKRPLRRARGHLIEPDRGWLRVTHHFAVMVADGDQLATVAARWCFQQCVRDVPIAGISATPGEGVPGCFSARWQGTCGTVHASCSARHRRSSASILSASRREAGITAASS